MFSARPCKATINPSASSSGEKKPRAARKSRTDKSADPGTSETPATKTGPTGAGPAAANDAKIVSLDKFRKK